MNRNIIWVAAPAAIVGSAIPAYATVYLTTEQAQQAIFPDAKMTSADVTLTDAQRDKIEDASGVRVRSKTEKVWRVEGGGWFLVDRVIGKHEFITWALGLNADGSVKQIEIMDYRETYGRQVRKEEWRSQFTGKEFGAKLKLGADIRNISGATLSCRHITDGVKRLLALYDIVLKKQ